MGIYPQSGIGKICGLFGKTRQAWYVQQWSGEDDALCDTVVLKRVKEIREQMPRIGTRKLYHMLTDTLQEHKIRIGRDKLFDLLEEYAMLVRRRKRRKVSTTDSNHPFRKYPNLIRGLQVIRPNQLWVSDITYIRIGDGFGYLSLITDAYSRKIAGYCLYPTLQKEGPVAALKMALSTLAATTTDSLIHHSDRGRQYCCEAYVNVLTKSKVTISMTEKGDPYENALAERMNKTLKEEFLLGNGFDSFELAAASVSKAVYTYNTLRPHDSCDRLTPDQAHHQQGPIRMKWKKRKRKEQMIT
jgi:transposase InsO family protein